MDLRIDHPAATGDALPVDLQMHSGTRLDHRHTHLGPQRGSAKKKEHQVALESEGLAEEDTFLLKCNFDELVTTNGEHQEYWLLAIQAAWEAGRLCAGAVRLRQQCTSGIT
jgi:hypothetical protein